MQGVIRGVQHSFQRRDSRMKHEGFADLAFRHLYNMNLECEVDRDCSFKLKKTQGGETWRPCRSHIHNIRATCNIRVKPIMAAVYRSVCVFRNAAA